MQQGAKFTEVWHIIGFLLVYTLIWYHTCKTHTAHSGANRLTYWYKYIFKPPVKCSQQLPLLHKMINE